MTTSTEMTATSPQTIIIMTSLWNSGIGAYIEYLQ
jgi:hypothetical protein